MIMRNFKVKALYKCLKEKFNLIYIYLQSYWGSNFLPASAILLSVLDDKKFEQ